MRDELELLKKNWSGRKCSGGERDLGTGSIVKGSLLSKTPEKISETADGRGRDDLEGTVDWIVKSSICQTKKLETSFNNQLEIRVLRFAKLKCND